MHVADINWWLLCLTNFPGCNFCFAQLCVAIVVATPIYKLVMFIVNY